MSNLPEIQNLGWPNEMWAQVYKAVKNNTEVVLTCGDLKWVCQPEKDVVNNPQDDNYKEEAKRKYGYLVEFTAEDDKTFDFASFIKTAKKTQQTYSDLMRGESFKVINGEKEATIEDMQEFRSYKEVKELVDKNQVVDISGLPNNNEELEELVKKHLDQGKYSFYNRRGASVVFKDYSNVKEILASLENSLKAKDIIKQKNKLNESQPQQDS